MLARDCDLLRSRVLHTDALPSLCSDPDYWYAFIMSCDWNAAVRSLHFVDSSCDSKVVTPMHGDPLAHQCPECNVGFLTNKAMASHRRTKHGIRNDIRLYISSSVCPCCKTDFRQRLRCLAHVSDTRRPKCRTWIMENVQQLPDKVACKLDAHDNELRKAARRSGHSHHLASGPAHNAQNKVVGRTSS